MYSLDRMGFVTGLYNAEDIALVPGTRWLIASGLVGPEHPQGHLYLVDTVARTGERIFPEEVAFRPAGGMYIDAPPDIETFSAHGLALRPGDDAVHTLYLVNHGGRESIEVFEVDTTADRPVVTWIGAILQADGVSGNAVTPLPDGGLVSTNFMNLNDPHTLDKVYAGEISGNLMEWHADRGWEVVPESQFSAPNGVDVSADGRWLFVAEWARKKFVRLSRGVTPVQRDEIQLDFMPDNVKRDEEGRLLTTGSIGTPRGVFDGVSTQAVCNFPVVALRIDPDTLQVTELARFEHESFGTPATALEIDGHLWISSGANDRIAYLPPVSDAG